MSVYDDRQAQREQDTQLQGAWAARIAADVAVATDRAYVTLDAFSEDVKFGPCRWQTRNDPLAASLISAITGAADLAALKAATAAALQAISLPAKGDACLVVFDDAETPWIAVWWSS